MYFGQVVIGAPGAGKTTYCQGMQQWMELIGRPVYIVNLDPMAPSPLPYECFIDIRELISAQDVMREYSLGPNGALLYSIEFLQENYKWLEDQLSSLEDESYVLFDCPGQVELYTHHDSMKIIINSLLQSFSLTAVQMVDSHHCSDVTKFVSVLLMCLSSTIHLELPMVNVLSKIDLLDNYGELDFPLDFYTNVLDLDYILSKLPDDPFSIRYKNLVEGLIEVVESYSLVAFTTLNISEKESVHKLLQRIDQANGYVYSSLPQGQSLLDSVFRFPVQSPLDEE